MTQTRVWTCDESSMLGAIRDCGLEVTGGSPLATLLARPRTHVTAARALDANQRRALEVVCRPELGLGVALSPPHGLGLVWCFDSGASGVPLVRYRLDASGAHEFREVGDDALLAAIRGCLHLDRPAIEGDFTLGGDSDAILALAGLVDANRARALRSLLEHKPELERTFDAMEIGAALNTEGTAGDARWLATVIRALLPVDVTPNEKALRRGLGRLAEKGLLEPRGAAWCLTDSGRILCAALATPIAYTALHGRWIGAGTSRQEHLAAFRTPEGLWLLEFSDIEQKRANVALRPVSTEVADLAFTERLMAWRRDARLRAANGGGRSAPSCGTCAKPLRAGAKFCSACGTRVPVPRADTPSAAKARRTPRRAR